MNTKIINLRQRSLIAFLLATTFLFLSHSSEGQTKGKRSQAARVVIGAYGYEPASIRLKRGIPARVTFLRTTDSTCATEVVFADYGIRRDLPLNQAVTVTFTPRKAGEFSFTCGMNMHRGKLIVS
jgi:plastocyanin domain-containing protein